MLTMCNISKQKKQQNIENIKDLTQYSLLLVLYSERHGDLVFVVQFVVRRLKERRRKKTVGHM